MSLTLQVKNELATVPVQKLCCRRSEIATTLRFAGGIHLVQHRHITIEAEVDTGGAARRLRQSIQEVFGFDTDLVVVNGTGLHSNTRYLVRMVRGGADLARLTGLLDRRGRPVRGLPVPVVGGGRCCQAAAWRGAFLARGSLTEPGRSMAMEITAPGEEAAMALVGAARRLEISAKQRKSRRIDRVTIRDGDAISAMLTRMGAHESVLVWEDRALEILGDSVPEHLQVAGQLRLEHRNASLEELGKLHEPPLTKDAIAGRIRRLLALADKTARNNCEPTTVESLPPEMRDDRA